MPALAAALALVLTLNASAAKREHRRPVDPALLRVWAFSPEGAEEPGKERLDELDARLRRLLGKEARRRKVALESGGWAELWTAPAWSAQVPARRRAELIEEARKSWPGSLAVQEPEAPVPPGLARPRRGSVPAPLLDTEAMTAQVGAAVPPALLGLSAGSVYDNARFSPAAAPLARADADLRDAPAALAVPPAASTLPGTPRPAAEVPAPGPAAPADERPFADVIRREAETAGVDPDVLHALIAANGGYDARRSRGGGTGLLMVTRDSADWVGVRGDLRDPALNVRAGARLLSKLLKMFDGDLNRALAAYRFGAGTVIKSRGIPNRKDVKDFLASFQRHYRGGATKPPVEPVEPPASAEGRRLVEETRAALGGTPEQPRVSFAGTSKWRGIISQAASTFGVDPALVESIMLSESEGRPSVVSSAGAKGLMQLMPATARGLGVKDIFDPEQNVNGGTKYLKQMLDRFNGNVVLAVAAYNAGPNRSSLRAGRVPTIRETVKYVTRVFKRYEQLTGKKVESLRYMTAKAQGWARREASRLDRLFRNDPSLRPVAAVPIPTPRPDPLPQTPLVKVPPVGDAAIPVPTPRPEPTPTATLPVLPAEKAADPTRGRAIGTPSNGRLVDGQRLEPEGTGYRSIRQGRGRFYGTGRLVAAVEWTMAKVHAANPSAPPIALGDLSARNGGDVSHHASHENGLDVDIVLAWKDDKGNPVFADEFVSLPARGSVSRGGKRVSFDAARTWLIVKGLAQNPHATVTHAFLDQSLINAVLRHAESAGEDKAVVSKASRFLQHWPNHKNHIHVRVK